jgi:hypothetical protein
MFPQNRIPPDRAADPCAKARKDYGDASAATARPYLKHISKMPKNPSDFPQSRQIVKTFTPLRPRKVKKIEGCAHEHRVTLEPGISRNFPLIALDTISFARQPGWRSEPGAHETALAGMIDHSSSATRRRHVRALSINQPGAPVSHWRRAMGSP